jgi:hypothetical protein
METGYFQYTSPPEAFFTYIKISVVAGIFLVSPYLFYQVWGFVAPGLYKHERRWLIPIAFFSAFFFVTGALFGYFVVFPFGFEFFAGFTTQDIQFIPKLNEYLSFALKLLFAFGIAFELPLFILFLARLGLVTAAGAEETAQIRHPDHVHRRGDPHPSGSLHPKPDGHPDALPLRESASSWPSCSESERMSRNRRSRPRVPEAGRFS